MTEKAEYLADPLSRQLTLATQVIDLRERPVLKRTLPSIDPHGAPVPCVVLADREWSGEMDAVAWRLSRAGVPTVRLDPESTPLSHLTLGIDDGVLEIDGVAVRVALFWRRDFQQRSVRSPAAADPVRTLAAANWSSFVAQLGSVATEVVNATTPGLLEQLRVAGECGITIPRTIVSTSLKDAVTVTGSNRVVVKAISDHWVEGPPGLLRGAFPESVDIDSTAEYVNDAGPVIIQEYVEHIRELRIYAVGADQIGFEVEKPSAAAVWMSPDEVRIRATAIPEQAAAMVRVLQQRLGIDYGAYDVLLTKDGRAVFLEVNLTGAWLWFEEKVLSSQGMGRHLPYWARMLSGRRPVTRSVTNLIRTRYRQALARTCPTDQSRSEPRLGAERDATGLGKAIG
ncbi:MAG: hypothetical protein QOE23_1538 [Pseudonocardiales bacterium]|nr:hypothetical protein [Pseudonocardiales bacterium]